jgi:hypothetical protein
MRKLTAFTLIVITGFLLNACYSLPPVSPPSASRIPVVAIVNNTGFECYSLYVKPAADHDWGNDLLGADVLPNGQSFRIKLAIPLSIADTYDIRMVDIDDDTYSKYRVQLANGSNIVFTKRDADEY